MKFMQRAAAAAPNPSTPTTPDEPSPKRRKKDSDSPSRPMTNIDELVDQRAVQAAIAAEEAKREAALERQGAEAGDTRWVLSFEDQMGAKTNPKLAIRVVQAGYANLDVPSSSNSKSIEEDSSWEDNPIIVGRRSFGRFNKVLEKQQDPSMEDSSSESDSEVDEDKDSEESNSDDDDDDDPTSELIKASRAEAAERAKAERKAKKKAEKAQSLELARQRKNKEVKLNGLTSLSGRQESLGGRTCYKCGGPHLQKDCPKRGFEGSDRGFTKKARTSR